MSPNRYHDRAGVTTDLPLRLGHSRTLVSHRKTGVGVVLLAVLVLMSPSVGRAQEPSLLDVLARATAYVTEFGRQLSGMVAEERYEQRLKELP